MISLIHPSRGRPEKSFNTATDWSIKAGVKTEVIVSIDRSDPMKQQYYRNYSVLDIINIANGVIIINENESVVEATNHAAKRSDGDILVYLSDDFFCFEGWGKVIEERIGDTSKPVMLKVDDCLQQFRAGVLTIPIMTRALYKMLGYFFHPEYKSMHVDVDLYETCKRLGVIKLCPDLKFPHNHVSNGKAEMDETYRRSTAHWNQGLEVISRRRRLGFPL